ncbi:glycerol-3-phosphate dehydrogenase [Rhodoligotrophos defluvii]|uniref:glycerol-3-phosphate dehydrogenase n=1 Tax=Rhodoligotrophos defluvii TaxID=2561934 RepID=UPI001EF07139|nr:glycerol-3-phosphate dehydrogenase [Rhodoligotrophos defluvii]
MMAPSRGSDRFDLAVIGGGINGCGVARDAAGRGLSVLLVEKGDLASATSSASTKLIHGGLRYLEHYAFRLVRESLLEREVLLRSAPHIIRPMRFVLPHHPGLRPAWFIRLGLVLYDHLGGRTLLPPTRRLDLRNDPAGRPLQPRYATAFEYSDCWVDDSRLVVLTALDAAQRGAVIRTRTELLTGIRGSEHWQLDLLDHNNGRRETVAARMLINAAGPWVAEVLEQRLGRMQHHPVRLVKGSHIVVPKLFDQPAASPAHAYIFQNADGRIVFAIPYQGEFTLIGTTDVDYRGDPGRPRISPEETDYLCTLASAYFTRPVNPADVVASYSGVRPLYDDGVSAAQAATRDYVLDRDRPADQAPLLTVYGGKITTFRRLAEHAMEQIADVFPGMGPAWTRSASLPGGDFPVGGHTDLVARIRAACPSCPPARAERLASSYGTRSFALLDGLSSEKDWGRPLGGDLTEREVRYLANEEWALTAEDVVWRRSKQGYHMSGAEIAALDAWLAEGQRVATRA